jgi:hypothetical protein
VLFERVVSPMRRQSCDKGNHAIPKLVQVANSLGFVVIERPTMVPESEESALRCVAGELASCGLLPEGSVGAIVRRALRPLAHGERRAARGASLYWVSIPEGDRVFGGLLCWSAALPWESWDRIGVQCLCLTVTPANLVSERIRVLEVLAAAIR